MADRVMETFAMEDKKQEVYSSLASIEKDGLGIKDSLMEAFKKYSDNLEYLSLSIDEVLEANRKDNKGREI